MEERTFDVRCYNKFELAGMYFPELEQHTAVDKLRRWMHNCAPLMSELTSTGFRPKMKTYTAREVRIIARHLGEPF